jgi:pyruvate formate lyase activating enzyme
MLTTFNIQRYSIHDGEGIRTNIFFKGCPLRCQWCNNPEGQDHSPSLMYDKRLCRGFGDCANIDCGVIHMNNGKPVINRNLIPDVTKYSEICPSKALVVNGEMKSVEQIVHEVEKDIPFFYYCKGGVTLTGGEPFSQGPDLRELIIKLKNLGIHISVETSLHVEWEIIEEYTGIIDMFLADLKHTDSEKFRRFTGGEARLIMDNIKKLNETEAGFIIRVPVVPLFNYSEQEIYSIIDFTSSLYNLQEINFIPFHNLGAEKYRLLGIEYEYKKQKSINKSDLEPFVDYACEKGLVAKIVE